MQCPCCGASGFRAMTFIEGVLAQRWKVLGLVASVTTAIVGQAHLIGEPWQHVWSVVSIISTAAVAWKIKEHPEKELV